MSTPFLATVPAAPEEAFLDAVASVLGSDPTIASLGFAIWTRGEGDRSQLPRFDPPSTALPLIRLLDGRDDGKWVSEGQHRFTLELNVEVFVPGFHQADRFRAATLVRGALYPADMTRARAVDETFNAVPGLFRNFTITRAGHQYETRGDADSYQRVAMTIRAIFDLPPG